MSPKFSVTTLANNIIIVEIFREFQTITSEWWDEGKIILYDIWITVNFLGERIRKFSGKYRKVYANFLEGGQEYIWSQ